MCLGDIMFADLPHTLGPHGAGIDSAHDSAEHLVGADIARSLFTADMLFPRLKGEDICPAALVIDGLADDTAGKVADELIGGRHEACIRAAEAHGDAHGL